MPPLANPRHERFAQELAKGKTATEAYVEAGYKPDDGNAARLTGNDRVRTRVAELQDRAALRSEITVAGITERLMNIADLAERTGVERDVATGEIKGTSPKHLTVARNALMDAAKLNGLIVDKSKVDMAVTDWRAWMLDVLDDANE